MEQLWNSVFGNKKAPETTTGIPMEPVAKFLRANVPNKTKFVKTKNVFYFKGRNHSQQDLNIPGSKMVDTLMSSKFFANLDAPSSNSVYFHSQEDTVNFCQEYANGMPC